MWIDLSEPLAGAALFRLIDLIAIVKDLAVEIGRIDGVGINEADFTDASGGEVEEGGRAESAGADAEDGAAFQSFLSLGA